MTAWILFLPLNNGTILYTYQRRLGKWIPHVNRFTFTQRSSVRFTLFQRTWSLISVDGQSTSKENMKNYLCFGLASIIPENSHKLPWIKNGEGFAVHSSNLTEWCARRVTCQLLIGDNKYTWYKIWYFFTCFVKEFFGAGNPFITP